MTLPDSLQTRRVESHGVDLDARRDEQLLAEHVRAGDPVAFEAIFRRHHRPMLALAQRLLGSRSAAEDVVQEVFLSVWTSRERWHVTTSIGAYLLRSVRNAATRHGSSASARRLEPIVMADVAPPADRQRAATPRWTPLVQPGPSPLERAEQAAITEHVARAVETLPPRAREVFTLSRNEQLTNREIAERLALSPKTVEMHLTRALVSLRSVLRGWRNG
jgi:RNA polymerase sigma-70 factor (ECF subfamily)